MVRLNCIVDKKPATFRDGRLFLLNVRQNLQSAEPLNVTSKFMK